MQKYSIATKLLLLVTLTFLVTTISVVMVADRQMSKLIDRNQNQLFSDKLAVIASTLQRVDTRLQKTGLVEAYKDGFQAAVIKDLRAQYYKADKPEIYPFIFDSQIRIVLHPYLKKGARPPKNYEWLKQMAASSAGHLFAEYKGQKKWYIYQHFAPWNWTICYTVPLEIKYRDATALHSMLVKIIVIATLAALFILYFAFRRLTRPIVKLTTMTQAIADGNLDQEIAISSRDEVGVLADSFIRMQTAIRQKMSDLEQNNIKLQQSKDELNRLRNYLSNIIDSMPSLLVGVDENGLVSQWNREAQRITGVASSDAMGQPFAKVISGLIIQAEQVEKAIATKQKLHEPRRQRLVDGRRCYEDVTIYPLIANGVQGAVIRVDDITERVQIEEMMVQSEKMMSVGGLAAGMAHEINNPLGVIIQAIQNIKRRVSAELKANVRAAEECGTTLSAVQAYLEKRQVLVMIEDVSGAGHRAAEIVANMLQFSRLSESSHQYCRLPELLENSLTLAANDYDLKKKFDFRHIEIVREFDETLPEVKVVKTEFEQVILNLLKNAAQAMAEDAMVDKKPTIHIRIKAAADKVRIEVEDNGPGMEEKVCKRIFEPFFTTKAVGSGTGLGLSVSYMIITNNHQGSMAVHSTPGEGTTFIVSLPIEV